MADLFARWYFTQPPGADWFVLWYGNRPMAQGSKETCKLNRDYLLTTIGKAVSGDGTPSEFEP